MHPAHDLQQEATAPESPAPDGQASLRALDLTLAHLSVEPSRTAAWSELTGGLGAVAAQADGAGRSRSAALARAAGSFSARIGGGARRADAADLRLLRAVVGRLHQLSRTAAEPVGDDADLLGALARLTAALHAAEAPAAPAGEGERRAAEILAEARLRGLLGLTQRARRRALTGHEAGVPLDSVWSGLAEFVRRQGAALGKRVELVSTGGDIQVPGGAAEGLRAALVQLVRNACDHGIETPAARQGAGKPAVAVVRLSGRRAGESVIVSLADDGRGLDPERVRDPRAHPRLARPHGHSDAGQAGVGLELARDALEGAGGEIALVSAPGRGAAFTLTLPAPFERARSAA